MPYAPPERHPDVVHHGPVKPPFQHPEWQGSVPSKWMDRGTGYIRGKPLHHADIRDGVNGIARSGFGPFSVDASTRIAEESLRRTKQFPNHIIRDAMVAPWGEHPQELRWKPGRRKLVDDEFEWRVHPATKHAGVLAHGPEPELLTKRPAFVMKLGVYALPSVYDADEDRCKQAFARKQDRKRRAAMRDEERKEKNMVRSLENWERDHVRRPMESKSLPSLASIASPGKMSTVNSYNSGPPNRSRSDTHLDFCRRSG